jgi:hypothetical protein
MIAVTGCGGSDAADGAGTSEPSAADLRRFVLTKADLPDGYKAVDRTHSSKPAGCLDLDEPDADREYTKRLAALGFKRCAYSLFRRTEKRAGEFERYNEPSSEAILVRDQHAASDALPALRRRLRVAATSTGAEIHSVAAPALGDEAPRGLSLSFEIQDMGKITGVFYIWRRGAAVAWVFSSDIFGDFDQRRTLTLARRLDRRIVG